LDFRVRGVTAGALQPGIGDDCLDSVVEGVPDEAGLGRLVDDHGLEYPRSSAAGQALGPHPRALSRKGRGEMAGRGEGRALRRYKPGPMNDAALTADQARILAKGPFPDYPFQPKH